MKKTLFIFFTVATPLLAVAQSAVVKDSIWEQWTGGKLYETRRVEYANGEYSEGKRLIGDTASVFTNYYRAFVREGERMAVLAFEARYFDKNIRGMIQRSDSVLATIGRDLMDTLTARFSRPLTDSTGWKISEDTSSLNVAFSVNGQGQFRYQIAGFPVRNASIISNTMRLNNYKATGKPLDLYRAPGGNWFSIDDRVRLRLPSNQGLNRAAEKTTEKPSPAPKKANKKAKKQ